MKTLERKWFSTFDELSYWALDNENIEIINIQEKNGLWYVYFWNIP